jgi:hypothetical protein
MAMVPKTAVALLTRLGANPTQSLASLLQEAMVLNLRGQLSARDQVLEAASDLVEGLGRCGMSEIHVPFCLLSRRPPTAGVS